MSKQFSKIAHTILDKVAEKTTAYQIQRCYKLNPPSKEKQKEIIAIRKKYEQNVILSQGELNLEVRQLQERHRFIEKGFMQKAMDAELEILKRPVLKEISIVK